MRLGAREKDSGVIVLPSAGRSARRSSNFVRLAELRKLSQCEQVAAVCYRVRGGQIEFLLVRTRGGGRWTFPKGSAEPGLTHAQAAALEAFEEAGVHGRIEETPFARYSRGGGAGRSGGGRRENKIVVNAFLCEVTRLCAPEESGRKRTWFSAGEAKLRLREGRDARHGAGFARVLERAVARVERLRKDAGIPDQLHTNQSRPDVVETDALQRVQFEAFRQGKARFQAVSLAPYSRTRLDANQYSITEKVEDGRPGAFCEVLPFSPLREFNRNSKLLTGGRKVKTLGTGAKMG